MSYMRFKKYREKHVSSKYAKRPRHVCKQYSSQAVHKFEIIMSAETWQRARVNSKYERHRVILKRRKTNILKQYT